MKALFALVMTISVMSPYSFAEDKKVENPIKSSRKRITTRGATMGVRGLVKSTDSEPIIHNTSEGQGGENKNLKKVDALEVPKEEIQKFQSELVSPGKKD